MEQFCALWKPSVDPEKIEVQPEGEDVPRLIIMQEFIPIPSEGESGFRCPMVLLPRNC